MERRTFLRSFASFLAAPAIVRVASIMPVKSIPPYPEIEEIGALYLDEAEIVPDLLRAYIPKLYVELWKATPLMAKLLEGSK